MYTFFLQDKLSIRGRKLTNYQEDLMINFTIFFRSKYHLRYTDNYNDIFKTADFPLLEDGQLVWATVKGLNVCATP